MKKSDSNFLPNIRCPFCGHVGPYAISGFAGELSIREKQCRKCEKAFVMVVYSCSAFPGVEIDDYDGTISSLRHRIEWLKQQRKKTVGQLFLEHNTAKEIYEQALEQAKKMTQKKEAN